jgi:hypothetical protein
MAHFAKLGLNSKVIELLAVDNEDIMDKNGIESEQLGIDFLEKLTRYPFWVQTSYNRNIRKNYAGIGDTYDESRDAFIAPQPFPSWVLDEDTCQWESPVPYPDDGKVYTWNEETLSWIETV